MYRERRMTFRDMYESDIERTPNSTVEQYVEYIAQRIQRLLALYGNTSQERDRTFPARIVYRGDQPTLSAAELKQRFDNIEKRRSQLIELGFLGKEQEGLSQPPEESLMHKADVLSVYVGDVEKKFEVFDDMAARLSLFLDIINRRLKYKSVRIGPEKTFIFESQVGKIAPQDLSSGEQHELVLLYELLFKVEKVWLVLIDEPEISLHIEWLNEYLNDLMKIVKPSGI